MTTQATARRTANAAKKTPARVPRPRTFRSLSPEQISAVLELLKGAQSVELKLSVPDAGMSSAVRSLGLDPLDGELRQVAFFDTPDLALNRAGLVLRARRVQAKPGDAVVKQRPVTPSELPRKLVAAEGFGVELDAMPGGYVCSGTLKARIPDELIRAAWAGKKPVQSLFTKQQRAFFASVAPSGLVMEDLAILGPVNVLKLKFKPKGFDRRMVAELWNYPDGSRILELSTKCLPNEAFEVAAEAKAFLAERGVDLTAAQQTKTKAALTYFSKQLQAQEAAAR